MRAFNIEQQLNRVRGISLRSSFSCSAFGVYGICTSGCSASLPWCRSRIHYKVQGLWRSGSIVFHRSQKSSLPISDPSDSCNLGIVEYWATPRSRQLGDPGRRPWLVSFQARAMMPHALCLVLGLIVLKPGTWHRYLANLELKLN